MFVSETMSVAVKVSFSLSVSVMCVPVRVRVWAHVRVHICKTDKNAHLAVSDIAEFWLSSVNDKLKPKYSKNLRIRHLFL
jgi:hypothetical protein